MALIDLFRPKYKHSDYCIRIEAVKKIDLAPQDIVVNIQGDQPVFQPPMLSELIRPLLEDSAIPMSTLMHKIEEEQELRNPNDVKVVVDKYGYALYFSRFPIPFFRDETLKTLHFKHLGFYAYRKEFLLTFSGLPLGTLEEAEKLEQLRALEHGFKIKVAETAFDSIEVDKPEDIQQVEERLTKMNNPGK